MMEIEIKFGKGRSDRVKVHYDDDADILAEVLYSHPCLFCGDVNVTRFKYCPLLFRSLFGGTN